MAVTIKDIAKEAGVSITTVSIILNNKDENISEETKKKVKSIIKKLNYKPNALARGLITKKTKTLAHIVPDITNPFFAEMARGVEDYASKYEYNVFLCNTDNNTLKERSYVNLLRERCVDGIIFSSSETFDDEYYKLLSNMDIPIVVLDRESNVKDYYGIFVDNFKGGYIATEHLIKLNHKKIGCIAGFSNLKNSMERVRGYKAALMDAGIEVNEDLIFHGNYSMEGGYKAALKLMNDHKVTAIFACNDLMACGVYDALGELGYNIPKDISVVGFDNIKIANVLSPKLTTVKQPIYHIGREASKMIIKVINHKKVANKLITLDVEMVVRNSTKEI